MTATKPGVRPATPHFSSGPCAKRPGWSLQNLTDAVLGRSHRSKIGKAKLKRAIDLTREVLEVPADYRIGIVPASDTGAVEIGAVVSAGSPPGDDAGLGIVRRGWVTDVEKQLKLKDFSVIKAPYGELPDLSKVDFSTDVVFTWNGTTSGVRVEWRLDCRWSQGLTICDATSAAFAQKLDWPKLDVGDVLMAEGARRGGRRTACSSCRRVPSNGSNLQAGLATAENFPPTRAASSTKTFSPVRRSGRASMLCAGGLSTRCNGRNRLADLRHDRAIGRQYQGAVGLGGWSTLDCIISRKMQASAPILPCA